MSKSAAFFMAFSAFIAGIVVGRLTKSGNGDFGSNNGNTIIYNYGTKPQEDEEWYDEDSEIENGEDSL